MNDQPRFYQQDTLENLVTHIGTERDKSTHNRYMLALLDKGQLDNAYRGDWISRKVVNIPAEDSTRQWRAWQAEKKQITAIENEERRLGVQAKVCDAMIKARLYGGAAIVIGANGDEASTELRPDSVRQGSVKFLHVVTRYDLAPKEIERNPLSPYFGEPKEYTYSAQNEGTKTLHPSRVVRFCGADLPDLTLSADGWGDSVLQSIDDAIKQVASASANVAVMLAEAKVDVIKVPRLMQSLSQADYKALLLERFSLANVAKSVVNTLLLDSEETWERISNDFTTLPEVLRTYLLIASGAADIPATRLLGQSAQGLNATGESDVRNYYDRISSDQNTRLAPRLARLDDLLVRSALGAFPAEVHYRWNPLWQLSENERADVAIKKANAHKVDVDANLISPEALRIARENQLIEDGFYPGFEQALEEGEELDEENEQVNEQFAEAQAAAAGETDPVGEGEGDELELEDALPARTLYVRRQLLNASDLLTWAREQGFDKLLPAEELHVTVTFSRVPVDWMKMGEAYPQGDGDLVVQAGGPRVVERLGPKGAVVLCFASTRLAWRHEDMVRAGCSWDFDDYMPHVTFTYEPGEVDPRKVEPYRGPLVFGPEIFEEVNEGWADKVRHE